MLRRVLNQNDINIFQRVSQSKTKITQKNIYYFYSFLSRYPQFLFKYEIK